MSDDDQRPGPDTQASNAAGPQINQHQQRGLKKAMHCALPLSRPFVIVAIYAVAFAASSYLGIIGIVIAVVVGTTGSVTVMVIRDKQDILAAFIVAAGSLIGATFAGVLGIPVIRLRPYSVANCVQDCVVLAVGAILGGLLFSWASKR